MADAGSPGAVLRELVAEAVGVDGAALLEDAALTERGDDPEPAARFPEVVAVGGTVVGVVPRAPPALARRLLGTGDASLEAVGDAGRDGETVRLVFTGRAADRLAGPSGAVLRPVLADRGVEAYRHDGGSPVGVLLVDDRAVVGLFDERGLAALLWSDAPAVREWAAATCGRYLAAADPA